MPEKPTIYLSDYDVETLRMVAEKYPNLESRSALIQHVLLDWRNRQDTGRSKDARIDAIVAQNERLLEQNECQHRLLVMLLKERGMYPLEGTTPIPEDAIIDACGRRKEK